MGGDMSRLSDVELEAYEKKAKAAGTPLRAGHVQHTPRGHARDMTLRRPARRSGRLSALRRLSTPRSTSPPSWRRAAGRQPRPPDTSATRPWEVPQALRRVLADKLDAYPTTAEQERDALSCRAAVP